MSSLDLELDILLAQVREPEPVDDGFVSSVIRDIESLPELPSSRLAALRRPLVAVTATAIVLTGGAVAALVGTQIAHDLGEGSSSNEPRASVSVDSGQQESSDPTDPAVSDVLPGGGGGNRSALQGSSHVASVLDPNTGLRLVTDTHTNDFTTGKLQRITLTLSNTGKKPLAITGYKDCFLQTMAFPLEAGSSGTGDSAADYYERYKNQTGVEWKCAGSDASPRVPTAAGDTFVLRPGETQSRDAMLALPTDGNWGVLGMCRCEVTDPSDPAPKDDVVFNDFTTRVLPSPLITLDIETGEATMTAPIRVRARS